MIRVLHEAERSGSLRVRRNTSRFDLAAVGSMHGSKTEIARIP